MAVRIHPTAEVSDKAQIGDGTSIWHHCQVRDAQIGGGCIFGKGVFVDSDVVIGNNVKIQNYVSVYHGVSVEDGVFIGPHVCFTNDMKPRAINPDGTLKSGSDWEVSKTLLKKGAALGANSTIRCGVTIGEWAMIGSGSVVTHDIPNYGLAYGNPARLHGFVCPCGSQVKFDSQKGSVVTAKCPDCGHTIEISLELWESIK